MKKKNSNSHNQPAWKRKNPKEIEAFRGELSILEDLSNGIRKGGKVKRKYKLKNENDITTAKERIKQKVHVKAQRIRRFEKRTKFYREMGKQPIEIKEPPSIKEVEKFWKKFWSNEKEHNEEAEQIKREEERTKETELQEWEDIEVKEVEFSLKKSHKWKSPGLDKLPNFWLSILTSTHRVLTHTLSQIMKNPEEIPEWLAKGITYLLPKVSETNNPRNYRPIT